MITISFGYSWAANRYHCRLWRGVIVHGVGYFIVLVAASAGIAGHWLRIGAVVTAAAKSQG
jgi:hypothetical protein